MYHTRILFSIQSFLQPVVDADEIPGFKPAAIVTENSKRPDLLAVNKDLSYILEPFNVGKRCSQEDMLRRSFERPFMLLLAC